MSLTRPLRLILLGAPGAGKGTQTSKLCNKFPTIQSFSSGDILRQQISYKTKIGVHAQSYLAQGKLVPDTTMCQLLTDELKKKNLLSTDSKDSFLLDGFPRTLPQAQELNKYVNLNLVVLLDVPEEVIVERISGRWVHVPSGRVYHDVYNPPVVARIDDVTGEPLTKRVDDQEETVRKRLQVFREEVGPLRGFYDKKGVFETISGETSDIIFPKLSALIEKKFCI